MVKEFKLPNLGENVESGDIISILFAEGDVISDGQPLLELETDKATVEVPSEVAGKVEKIHVAAGDTVLVGQVILTLVEGAAAAEQIGEESPAEVKSAPAVSPSPEPDTKPESKRPASEEQQRVGAAVVDFKKKVPPSGTRIVPASPSVRRFAREIGIDITQVVGTGPKGRISVEDIKTYSRQSRGSQSFRSGGPEIALPDFSRFGEVERERFTSVRRATSKHMAAAWANVAHVTNHDRADVTQLEDVRKKYASKVEEGGGKLTVTAIAVKVAAVALKKFPKFNSSIDVESQEVVYKKYFNIGVAVDTERGLLVPVIRDVESKSIVEIAVELKGIAEKARTGKIALDDLQGGCFTITNLGGIGGTAFTPIVNFPEVAILGVSRTTVEPLFINGEFQPRKVLPLSLSYDHRLIDGADAARFLRWIAEALENPFLLSLEG